MRARVLRVDVQSWTTVITATAETEAGERFTFAGDHRPMRYIAEALAAGEEVWVDDIESWQILGHLTKNEDWLIETGRGQAQQEELERRDRFDDRTLEDPE